MAHRLVFSAQAEVFLVVLSKRLSSMSFLRASGGVSSTAKGAKCTLGFSPRKRRCFYGRVRCRGFRRVFSAQAEVFLPYSKKSGTSTCFLRASGGVSCIRQRLSVDIQFSPRKRRCFLPIVLGFISLRVFSAQAEVFLWLMTANETNACFLRASGGVSIRFCA